MFSLANKLYDLSVFFFTHEYICIHKYMSQFVVSTPFLQPEHRTNDTTDYLKARDEKNDRLCLVSHGQEKLGQNDGQGRTE